MKDIAAFVLDGMSRIPLSPTIFADEVRTSDREAFRKDLEKLGRDFRVAMGHEENRQTKGRVDRNPQ